MLDLAAQIAISALTARSGRPSSRYVCSSPECRAKVTGVLRCLVCRNSICYRCDRIFDGICRGCIRRLDRVNHYSVRDARGRFAK